MADGLSVLIQNRTTKYFAIVLSRQEGDEGRDDGGEQDPCTMQGFSELSQ
jgi:hypothetical protein